MCARSTPCGAPRSNRRLGPVDRVGARPASRSGDARSCVCARRRGAKASTPRRTRARARPSPTHESLHMPWRGYGPRTGGLAGGCGDVARPVARAAQISSRDVGAVTRIHPLASIIVSAVALGYTTTVSKRPCLGTFCLGDTCRFGLTERPRHPPLNGVLRLRACLCGISGVG